jgi:myxalamid-type polyketide synthase MxaB
MTETFQPLPHTVFTREQTIAAFRYMQQGKHQGKIIIAQESFQESFEDQGKHPKGYAKRYGLPLASPKGVASRPASPFAPTHKIFTGTYLITGGMGAIGLQIAQWLVTKGVTNIILLGRNDIKPELKDNLEKLQHSAHINLIKADIANTDQLAQVLIQIELELPPLKGVVHCAGIISDRTIAQQDWRSFEQVLAPKVQGAWNLHHLTQKYDLENFILFSSASSLLGSAGQANYCAANAFLDTLAHARRNLGLPAIAINWCAWKNTGLAANTQLTKGLKQQGIGSIKPNQGIEILEQLLLNAPAQIGVIPFDWDVWQQHNSVTPYYEDLVSVPAYSENSSNYKQHLLAAIPEQREYLLKEQISQQLGDILGIKDLSKIDLASGFAELGLDSLGSVELRNKIQSSYNLKLSPTVIFDYSNLTALTNYLSSLLFNSEPIKNKEAAEINKNALNIENLSESQAETLLLEELSNFDFELDI